MNSVVDVKTITDSIVEIYGYGVNYKKSRNFGDPMGVGFMVSESLMLTLHSLLPTREAALMTQIKFPGRPKEANKLDPEAYFSSDPNKNITVVGLKTLSPVVPISVKNNLELAQGDRLWILSGQVMPYYVSNIESKYFYFRSREEVPEGTPIFSESFKLQGIVCGFESTNYFKKTLRVDSLFKAFSLQSPQQTQVAYQTQPHSKRVYKLDYTTRKKDLLDLEEDETIKGQNWEFLEDCCSAKIDENNLLVTGGNYFGEARSDVFQVNNFTQTISRKRSMLNPRSGHTLVLKGNYLYAIGGEPYLNLCERFSVFENKWEPISSLNIGRKQASGILICNESQMLVVGGTPERAGVSFERYSFEEDAWELLDLSLDLGVVRPRLFEFQRGRIAILGGNPWNQALVLEVKQKGEFLEELKLYTLGLLPETIGFIHSVTYESGTIKVQGDSREIEYRNLEPKGRTMQRVSQPKGNIVKYQKLLTPDYQTSYY